MVNLEGEHKVYIIDFGLSCISDNVENQAVDIFVLEKSLYCEENSSRFADELVKVFFIGYKKFSTNYKNIKKRLEEVKLRGRKKLAFG